MVVKKKKRDDDLFLLDWGGLPADDDQPPAHMVPPTPPSVISPPLASTPQVVISLSLFRSSLSPLLTVFLKSERYVLHTCQQDLEDLCTQVEAVESSVMQLGDHVVHVFGNSAAADGPTGDTMIQQDVQLLNNRLDELVSHRLCTVVALYKIAALRLRLVLAGEQARIYAKELRYLASGSLEDLSEFAKAVFIKQPRAQTVKRRMAASKKVGADGSKKKKSQFDYVVRILMGKVVKFEPDQEDALDALLQLVEDHRAKPLRGATVPLEIVDVQWELGIGALPQLSFGVLYPDGTQVVPAFLVLALPGQVSSLRHQHAKYRTVCTTINPNPIVVTTNENQWESAECRVVRREVFGDQQEASSDFSKIMAPWPKLCNSLSLFFVRSSRQDLCYDELLSSATMESGLLESDRPLSSADVAFLHERKLDGSHSISLAAFEEFWKWFGSMTHGYRHNHVLRSMFLKGLIYGFVPKERCAQVLGKAAPGTFLIRNSEQSSSGEFALAFVNAHHLVKHHKIDAKKLKAPYGNLADFVKEKDQLTHLVKLFHIEGGTIMQGPVLVPKDEAFSEFCSVIDQKKKKKNNNNSEDGNQYVDM